MSDSIVEAQKKDGFCIIVVVKFKGHLWQETDDTKKICFEIVKVNFL